MLTRQEYSSLRQGLVGAWCPSLGSSGYTLLDRSGRNNHGTLTNMGGQDNWRASGSGAALNLDGTDDKVTTSFIPQIVGTVSYSVWVYPRVLNSFQGIFSTFTTNSQALELFVDNPGSRFVVVNYGNSTYTVPAAVNAWQHVAVSVSGTSAASYLNGSLVSSATITAIGGNGSALVIGQRSAGAPTYAFNGLVDDLRLYSRTLTASEIRLLASRRGIGLTPLPDRVAALPRKLSVNVGGTWRAADAYVKVGGVWRLSQASVNVAGTWR